MYCTSQQIFSKNFFTILFKNFFIQIGLFSPLFKVASHNWNCCSIFIFFLTQSNFSLPTLSVTHFTMNDFYSKLLQNADDGGSNYSGTGCSIWKFVKISAFITETIYLWLQVIKSKTRLSSNYYKLSGAFWIYQHWIKNAPFHCYNLFKFAWNTL